jgi:reactive intermediate/imine deaminase
LFQNRALVRALLSFGAAFTADWSFSVAIGLVAFAHGGALAVGLVGLVRLLPAALLAPVISVYADRVPRERVLFASGVVRGVATLGVASVLAAHGPVMVVYALAVVSTMAFTPYRASHSALVPSLCRSPDELTSVNVVRGALDSTSVILGPLVAALLLAVWDISAVFVFAGACALISAGLVVRLQYESIPLLVAPRQRLQAAIRGAFSVFVVVVAIKVLHGQQSSVGLLQGAVGIGALLGSIACTLLVGSRAMTRWLGVAIVLWGAPIALIGLFPHYVVALLAAGVIGIGNALVDVTAFTLIARMVPNAVLARVFGVLESLGALAVGVGFIVAPLLIGLLATKGALLTVGAIAPVVCLLCWRRLTTIDASVAVRTDDIILLRQVPMLRPLPVPVIEQLAHSLQRTELLPGETVFEAGNAGDSFYVVAGGTVVILDGDQLVRSMGTGQGFGEIALLRNTTRTMTVRAVDDVQLFGISRSNFLSAITSIDGARIAAEATALAFRPMDAHGDSPRQAVTTDTAPAALGPYSQAIVAGGFVFCSGTAGIDPESGHVAEGIEAQTEQALLNIAAILNAAGASMADLVKTTIFYADVADFAKLNEVYARHMPDPPPARSAPANVRLPRGLLVSIEAIALLPT